MSNDKVLCKNEMGIVKIGNSFDGKVITFLFLSLKVEISMFYQISFSQNLKAILVFFLHLY